MTIAVGCKEKLDVGDFIYTVEISDYIYGLGDEEVPEGDIGRAIEGHDGIRCKYSECPAPDGTEFYEIRGTSLDEAIARKVHLSEEEVIYLKCIMIEKSD